MLSLKYPKILIKRKILLLQPFFTDRVFQIFDKDNSGTISLQEFVDAMHQFAGKSPDDKIKFLFKVYDIDGTKITFDCFFIIIPIKNLFKMYLFYIREKAMD